MQSIGDIKRRITAISKTRKITNAMYLLSASKIRRVTERIGITKGYLEVLRRSMKDIIEKSHDVSHPYLHHREGQRTAFIVISADKGMAGGYNRNILQYAHEIIKSREVISLLTVGSHANRYFTRQGFIVDVDFRNVIANPTMFAAREIAYDVLSLYDNDLMDEVRVIFTRYDASGRQICTDYKLLPIALEDFEGVEAAVVHGDMIYHPSMQALFDQLVPEYVIGMLYGSLVHAFASENNARMIAMKNSTDNADEMLKSLNLEYNRARQNEITREISEIVGASEALRLEDH